MSAATGGGHREYTEAARRPTYRHRGKVGHTRPSRPVGCIRSPGTQISAITVIDSQPHIPTYSTCSHTHPQIALLVQPRNMPRFKTHLLHLGTPRIPATPAHVPLSSHTPYTCTFRPPTSGGRPTSTKRTEKATHASLLPTEDRGRGCTGPNHRVRPHCAPQPSHRETTALCAGTGRHYHCQTTR